MTFGENLVWAEELRKEFPDFDLSAVDCGAGWKHLLRELLTAWRDISPNPGDIKVESISQDHGELRCYYHAGKDIEGAAENAYDDVQVKSHVTCELTGRPGLLVERDGIRMVRAYDLLKKGDVISDPD